MNNLNEFICCMLQIKQKLFSSKFTLGDIWGFGFKTNNRPEYLVCHLSRSKSFQWALPTGSLLWDMSAAPISMWRTLYPSYPSGLNPCHQDYLMIVHVPKKQFWRIWITWIKEKLLMWQQQKKAQRNLMQIFWNVHTWLYYIYILSVHFKH